MTFSAWCVRSAVVLMALSTTALHAHYQKLAWSESVLTPQIQMTDLNEQPLNTAELKAKLLVLNF